MQPGLWLWDFLGVVRRKCCSPVSRAVECHPRLAPHPPLTRLPGSFARQPASSLRAIFGPRVRSINGRPHSGIGSLCLERKPLQRDQPRILRTDSSWEWKRKWGSEARLAPRPPGGQKASFIIGKTHTASTALGMHLCCERRVRSFLTQPLGWVT